MSTIACPCGGRAFQIRELVTVERVTTLEPGLDSGLEEYREVRDASTLANWTCADCGAGADQSARDRINEAMANAQLRAISSS